jgi:hypothetical protein
LVQIVLGGPVEEGQFEGGVSSALGELQALEPFGADEGALLGGPVELDQEGEVDGWRWGVAHILARR